MEETEGRGNVTPEADAPNYPLYALDQPLVITIEDLYVHKLRHASFDDEDRRERMSVTIKRTVPKVDGEPAVSIVNDDGRANEVYYHALAETVSGFLIPESDEQPDEEITPCVDLPVTTVFRVENAGEKDEKKILVRDLIPAAQKLRVAKLVYGGIFDLVKQPNRIRLGRSSETEITQKLGIEELEDGSRSQPTHLIRYFFREAEAKEISTFEGRAVTQVAAAIPSSKGGGQEERRTVSMETCVGLTNKALVRVTGATIDGQEIGSSKELIEKIAPSIKKTLAMMYFGHLVSLKGK